MDEIIETQEYSSRSGTIREALRDFLTDYRRRRELEGEQLGTVTIVYDHEVHGLADDLLDTQHEDKEIVRSVQRMHIGEGNCLETLIVRGEGERIRELVDKLGSCRGVKQVALLEDCVISPYVTIERNSKRNWDNFCSGFFRTGFGIF